MSIDGVDQTSGASIESDDQLTRAIIGAAIAVHKELGPGLLESAYEACLAFEFEDRGIPFRRQVELPVLYRGRRLECGYRLDFVVAELVVVELKSIAKFEAIHEAQLLTYLRLSGFRRGLLPNFNCAYLRGGIKRMVL